MSDVYAKRSRLGVPADAAFAWHGRPGALERLVPPWSGVSVLERSGGIENGARTVLRMPVAGPLAVRWVAEHTDYHPGRSFRDVQVKGPFRRWEHVHSVEPVGPRDCVLEDRVTYALPLGAPVRALTGEAVRGELERTFRFRHRTTSQDLALHALRSRRPLTVAIAASDGMVGRALCALLSTGGHRVVRFVARRADDDEIAWDPETGAIERERLEEVDAVVCLRVHGIAARRWSAARKARLTNEGVGANRTLATAIAQCRRPKAFVSVSSIGFYGAQGYQRLDDDAPAGAGFWSEVRRRSESVADVARQAGVRVVHLRAGCVLSSAGGALKRMLPAFRLGLGPVLGCGRQFLAWVSLDDLIGAILWAITGDELDGPVNVVAPQTVTQREMATTLAQVMERPLAVRIPRAVVSGVLGEMGREVLLASVRAVPEKLLRIGYPFRDPSLALALRHTLGAWPANEDDEPR